MLTAIVLICGNRHDEEGTASASLGEWNRSREIPFKQAMVLSSRLVKIGLCDPFVIGSVSRRDTTEPHFRRRIVLVDVPKFPIEQNISPKT